MFDHNKMNELKHLAADRYQRSGCGGTHKVYETCAAFDKSRGYGDMSAEDKAAYRKRVEFISTAESLLSELAYVVNGTAHYWEQFEATEKQEAARYGVTYHGIPF